ncbi:hypothetical protein [Aquirufa antheringensis]|jgi:hypothetical protein|uniref:hypothetical protein n=1 Tax=Aquirufa antheringensis TaxID=2516559 RepID=UPI001032A920|nr:hypothetical protein [Aquirufa antheringensis]MCE4216290.1 hypothetical protein [Pseudarcicella sp. GAP-15]MCZ2477001.1 hypothetical protein [Aquirufa antheringensis]TBH70631.1 hypothetical protein EWU21_08230 [Aquirufa antheringensis]USQ04287.1 hypothetical protein G9X63_09250 [Aquirufa antheringensis]
MKKTLLLASCLIGLNLVAVAGEEARSFNRSNDLSVKTETLSEVITSLIRKDAQLKSASAASLTISILEDFQNNKTEFLKASESEKVVFNQTIKTISEQGQNFSDTKTLNWIKEINQTAKKINLVWSIVGTEPVIDTNFDNSSEQQEHLIVML